MKKIFGCTLASLLACHLVLAASTPFSPEEQARFRRNEANITSLQTNSNSGIIGTLNAGSTDGITAIRTARVTYDVSVSGGTPGTYNLGVVLPAASILRSGYLSVKTQFTKSGSPTLALQCEDSANMLTAEDISVHAAGSIISLKSGNAGVRNAGTGILSIDSIAADCVIQAVVASGTLTAGKLVLFQDFYVGY